MAASYPTSIKSFAAKVNGDVIEVAHVTGLEEEVVAIESNPTGLNQDFRGLHLRTSPNADVANTTVTLIKADAITMANTTGVGLGLSALTETWTNLSAVITSSGAGGLDTGSEAASTWYEI